ALAVPVWVAIHFVPDWRWLIDRDDSPWYPTMRLFRQRTRGDWEDVFRRIADELHKELGSAPIRLGRSAARIDAERLFQLALGQFQKGELAECEPNFRAALKLIPDFHAAYENLGVALARQGKLEEAVDAFKAADRLAPNSPENLNNLGLATLQLN